MNVVPGCPTCKSVVGVSRIKAREWRRLLSQIPAIATHECGYCGWVGPKEELTMVEVRTAKEDHDALAPSDRV